ncbi:inner-membrane translocator [Arthrobacter crystallopoietes BAB-32]|uniref:Inner-membrane translocator n=1 Tax=Arthrobacter crystallopoietes BAB-32 TaxID=1246476 RepID=N1V832_9MICC|nr:ABC transporter permease [Arthrobacter crystallopoietes]EMY36164.1 inner-membrane translocator [Arthrobacter crystallopoietes BAB-32]
MKPTFLYWNFRALIAWVLALLAIAGFASSNPDFLQPGNLYALLQIFSPLVLVACGLGVVMLAGEFDISISGTFPLVALVSVKLSDSVGTPLAVLIAIALGIGFGLLNGWVTARFRIPSLAVTVGSMVLAIGIGYAIAGGQIVQMSDFDSGMALTQAVGGIFSLQSLIQLVLAALIILTLRATWLGRYVYAAGSDANRARASGMPVSFTVIAAFAISGLAVGLAGALQGVSLASGTAGPDDALLLQAATAAILGGISLNGGKGSLVGVVGAALLLAVLSNGLSFMGTTSATIQLVSGAILLAVVIVDKPLDRFTRRYIQSSTVSVA